MQYCGERWRLTPFAAALADARVVRTAGSQPIACIPASEAGTSSTLCQFAFRRVDERPPAAPHTACACGGYDDELAVDDEVCERSLLDGRRVAVRDRPRRDECIDEARRQHEVARAAATAASPC